LWKFDSCFISHSSKDRSFAERLHADLQAKGIRCRFAPHHLKTGDRFRLRMGAMAGGKKELIAVADGYHESDRHQKVVDR